MRIKSRPLFIFSILGSAVAYFFLAYFSPRTHFGMVLGLYSATFAAYLYLAKYPLTLRAGFTIGFFFRLIFLVATPALSDDYFRFIWDGTLLTHGQNPYQHLPVYYQQTDITHLYPALTPVLFAGLNSPEYFSLYPPICQAWFGLANLFGGTNILANLVLMRLVLLLAEIGSFIMLVRLVKILQLPTNRIWWYFLNPLIILEITGNLHPEGLLIFFLLASIYFLLKNKTVLSAILLGLAIGVKLWPLMFMPVLLKKLGFKKFILYGPCVLLVVTLLFIPFLSPALVLNILNSLDLYFRQFEFNASIYYVARWLGYLSWNYNLIDVIGPLLSFVTLAGILYLAFRPISLNQEQFITILLFSFSVYLFLATVVHPWYLCTLVALTTLTNWRYPIAWSATIYLSYAAYATKTYSENLLFVFLEYTVVFGFLAYEWYWHQQQKNISPSLQSTGLPATGAT